MSELRPEDYGETPTVVVRVYRDGRLWLQELCESDDEASLAVEEWSELEGVTCEVDDLSVRHRADEILAPEAPEPDTDERRRGGEPGQSAGRAAWERYGGEPTGG
jgi:hypothetical protein